MQRPKQEGLGAAFGGGMTDQAFGARTTDVLQKGTVYLGTALFILTFIISVLVGADSRNKSIALDISSSSDKQMNEAAALLPVENEDSDDSLTDELNKAVIPDVPTDDAVTPAAEGTTQRDTATGAQVGAVSGRIIGKQSGKVLEGAAVGGDTPASVEIPTPAPATGNGQ